MAVTEGDSEVMSLLLGAWGQLLSVSKEQQFNTKHSVTG